MSSEACVVCLQDAGELALEALALEVAGRPVAGAGVAAQRLHQRKHPLCLEAGGVFGGRLMVEPLTLTYDDRSSGVRQWDATTRTPLDGSGRIWTRCCDQHTTQ